MFLFPSSYLDISQVSYFIRRFVEEKNLAAMCQSALHIPCQFYARLSERYRNDAKPVLSPIP
jgi:hypothetical protein